MFANLSLAALMRSTDLPTAIELADRHGFGGLDPDLAYFRSLGDLGRVREVGATTARRGLRWGTAPLRVSLAASADTFTDQLGDLRRDLPLYQAAGVTALGTWIRPTHEDLTYRHNWTRHLGRLALLAEVLGDAGMVVGLEYVGPKTFWSTERHPFVHTLAEVLELLSDTGATNVGVMLDTFHWYTAGESAADLRALRPGDVVSVDLNDAPAGRARDAQQDLDRRLPGETGVIDLGGFLDALDTLGYDGPVKVEPFMKSLGEGPIDVLLSQVSSLLVDVLPRTAGARTGRGADGLLRRCADRSQAQVAPPLDCP